MLKTLSNLLSAGSSSSHDDIERGKDIYCKNDHIYLALFAIAIYRGEPSFCPEKNDTLMRNSKSQPVRDMMCMYNWLISRDCVDCEINLDEDSIKTAALKVAEKIIGDIVFYNPTHENIDKLFEALQPIDQLDILSQAFQRAEKIHSDSLNSLQDYIMVNVVRGLALKPDKRD